MAGKNVYIYSKSGKFIKEITFSDALIVNSMCIVPELEELWVVSRFKIINKFKLDGAPVKKVSLPFPCAAIIPTAKQDFLVYSGGANTENVWETQEYFVYFKFPEQMDQRKRSGIHRSRFIQRFLT